MTEAAAVALQRLDTLVGESEPASLTPAAVQRMRELIEDVAAEMPRLFHAPDFHLRNGAVGVILAAVWTTEDLGVRLEIYPDPVHVLGPEGAIYRYLIPPEVEAGYQLTLSNLILSLLWVRGLVEDNPFTGPST